MSLISSIDDARISKQKKAVSLSSVLVLLVVDETSGQHQQVGQVVLQMSTNDVVPLWLLFGSREPKIKREIARETYASSVN